jgi:hypothetical protein
MNAAGTQPQARTPEELELLFEDACVLRDRAALPQLFDREAVVGSASGGHRATGRAAIVRMIDDFWNDGGTYLALPARVLQSGPTALIIAGQSIHVARRGTAGWRYQISWWGF